VIYINIYIVASRGVPMGVSAGLGRARGGMILEELSSPGQGGLAHWNA